MVTCNGTIPVNRKVYMTTSCLSECPSMFFLVGPLLFLSRRRKDILFRNHNRKWRSVKKVGYNTKRKSKVISSLIAILNSFCWQQRGRHFWHHSIHKTLRFRVLGFEKSFQLAENHSLSIIKTENSCSTQNRTVRKIETSNETWHWYPIISRLEGGGKHWTVQESSLEFSLPCVSQRFKEVIELSVQSSKGEKRWWKPSIKELFLNCSKNGLNSLFINKNFSWEIMKHELLNCNLQEYRNSW